MERFPRITLDPAVMAGRPCIRGTRLTVGMIVSLLAAGHSEQEVLQLYPQLALEDIREALAFAAWRSTEPDTFLRSA